MNRPEIRTVPLSQLAPAAWSARGMTQLMLPALSQVALPFERGRIMTPHGTRDQGRVKRWKCPVCERTEETTGTAV